MPQKTDPLAVTDKTTRLLAYLAAIAKINSKKIRRLDKYKNVFWLHSIPRIEQYCFTQAWGISKKKDRNLWVEITKIRKPAFPFPPKKCLPWVQPDSLKDSRRLPQLKQTLSVAHDKIDRKNPRNKTLYLKKNPKIQQEWQEYIQQQWKPWAQKYRRYAAVQQVYTELFHIYQEQQKNGEQYELVLALGLLNWKSKRNQDIRRHLIVAKVLLSFNPGKGKFTVRPAEEGEQIAIELDMLDMQPTNAQQLVKESRAAIDANPWARTNVDAVLHTLATSLAANVQGTYHPTRLRPEQSPSSKPVIEFAPALILRKRSTHIQEQL
ncbi:MAG: AAA family ATPase, partial [Candidatus Electrothrix sp. AR3]|nr:AAA family ATPase [Candidatus Electrothrix sp. AR3]